MAPRSRWSACPASIYRARRDTWPSRLRQWKWPPRRLTSGSLREVGGTGLCAQTVGSSTDAFPVA